MKGESLLQGLSLFSLEITMNVYRYDGPVMIFGKIVNERWDGETVAKTEDKARSNLIYQYKRSHNRSLYSKVSLPGKLMIVY